MGDISRKIRSRLAQAKPQDAFQNITKAKRPGGSGEAQVQMKGRHGAQTPVPQKKWKTIQ
jgi:hypothetical protein